MLLYHFDVICKSTLIILLLILACMVYTYFVNLQRKEDDPKKRAYHPSAILLAPITVPFFFTLAIFMFILRAVLFMGFLIVFTILLIALRKPFIFKLWEKFATKVGDPLLKVNTRLIKLAFSS